MKKIGILILGLCSTFLVGNFTQAKDYEYTNLSITANILEDGTINVKEDFTADFFVSKHGIIRDIPLNYSVGGKDFHIEVSDIRVPGKTYTTSKNNGNIEIKIGDADRTIIGEQNYPISYTTYGLIRNFSGMGYAELYWNLVGYDFDTNINKVRAEIILPKTYTGFTAEDFLITTDGKSITIDGFDGSVDWSKGDRIIITYDKGLPAYQGITLTIKFPNNYFEFDHDRQSGLIGHNYGYKSSQTITNDTITKIINIIFNTIGLIFKWSFFIIIFLLVIQGKSATKSNKINLNEGKLTGKFAKQFPVIIQYDPPKGLNSAEVGLLLHRDNQFSRIKDLFSLIYKWASEGLITIEPRTNPKKEKYGINVQQIREIFKLKSNNNENKEKIEYDGIFVTKKKNIPSSFPDYEKYLFDCGLLGDNSIIFKNNYLFGYDLYDQFDEDGNYLCTPTRLYMDLVYSLPKLENYCIEKGWKKPRSLFSVFTRTETEQGAKIISHILGYRKFLAECDENKLRLLLKQDPFYFDKILPYAIVFGLETELIQKIMPIMQEMHISSNIYSGDLIILSETFSDISSSLQHSYSESSSYSSDSGFDSGSSFSGGGGGFSSGGGGGGGGGRSW